jgi:hypothetical protein
LGPHRTIASQAAVRCGPHYSSAQTYPGQSGFSDVDGRCAVTRYDRAGRACRAQDDSEHVQPRKCPSDAPSALADRATRWRADPRS